jgi:hypothetical protein
MTCSCRALARVFEGSCERLLRAFSLLQGSVSLSFQTGVEFRQARVPHAAPADLSSPRTGDSTHMPRRHWRAHRSSLDRTAYSPHGVVHATRPPFGPGSAGRLDARSGAVGVLRYVEGWWSPALDEAVVKMAHNSDTW